MQGDIYLVDTTNGKEENLTGGKGNNWQAVWSPDGEYLAFLSDRDGSGQARLWIWNRKTRTMRVASEIASRGDQVEWLPRSHKVLFTTLPVGMSVDAYVQRFEGPPTSTGYLNQPAGG